MILRDKTLEECITILDREIPNRVNASIAHILNDPNLVEVGVNDYWTLVSFTEQDPSQITQAGSKQLQNYINVAIVCIIKQHNLPIQYTGDAATGFDYKYVGNNQEIEIEVKCSGQKDGSTIVIGNLKLLNTKTDLTLAFRYKVEGKRIVEWQTVTITDSNRKWKQYNSESSTAGYSQLRCKTDVDLQDITCYSGSIKPNKVWVKFIKETLDARNQ